MNIASRSRSFITASLVFFGLAASVSQAQTVNVNGAACASATVTLGAGTININTAGCSGTPASPPTISTVSPGSGMPGVGVTINGANLNGASVTIGGAAASVIGNTGSAITTSVPSAATVGAGNVVVTVAGLAPASFAFTVLAPPPATAPIINTVSPASGAVGSTVTISGSGFSGATVTIGGTAANITNTGTVITATVPAAATVGAGSVVVTVPTFTAASFAFTVLAPPPPTISTVSPSAGAPNTPVTISGTGLAGASVTIAGIAAAITTSSASSITTAIPATAPLGVANIVVTTSAGTATSSALTVTAPPIGGGDSSIEGQLLPNPSKAAFLIPPGHQGLNGAGPEVNAYAMAPARCATTPALTRSWQHNIDLADYKGKNAFDFFVMQANESLSYKFTVGNVDASGGFIYNDAANAVVRPTFISITAAPCDFDTSKLVVGATRDSCYQTGLNGNSVNWANITGPLPAAYCRLIKGNTYYMNIRFQDGRPASIGGSPTQDSCTTGNCGGIIQVL